MRWLLLPLLLVACTGHDSPGSAIQAEPDSVASAPSAQADGPLLAAGRPSTSASTPAQPSAPLQPAAPPRPTVPRRFDEVVAAGPAPGPAPTGGFALAADRCLQDPACDLTQHASLLLAAVDAGEEVTDCHRLLRGRGVPVNLARARVCFERAVAAEQGWEGSSPSPERLQVSLMRARGLGGPRDPRRARDILTGSFGDASLLELEQHVDAEERGQPMKNDDGTDVTDVCYALAMTTLAMNQCANRDLFDIELRSRAVRKELHARFGAGAGAVAAFDRMWASCGTFAESYAELGADANRGGTMAPLSYAASKQAALLARLERVETVLRDGRLPDPATVTPDLRASVRTARAVDTEHAKLVDSAEAAWPACRASEVSVFSGIATAPGEKAIGVLLEQQHVAELEASIPDR